MSELRYRMIAIDLDGTLLCPRGTVTPRTKSAIHRVRQAGLRVCFATGRNWTESRTVIRAVEHYSSAVFVGGAMVMDTEKEITLHRQMMESKLAAEVCEVFESAGHAALALQDTAAVGVDYLMTQDVPLNHSTQHWTQVTSAKVRFIPNLGQHAHSHTIRVGIVAEPAEVRRIKAQLEERFAERIVTQSIHVPVHEVDVLEVFDPSVNKWQGLLHVARHHSIDPRRIIAVGDDVNDLAMIQHAGLGVAMGNARPEVKAIARRVIGANAEEGLAVFLEELIERQLVEPLQAF